MDFSNFAREFLDGVLQSRGAFDQVDDSQQLAHHHYPVTGNSSLDTTQETNSESDDEHPPRRVQPGTSARKESRQRTSPFQCSTTIGDHNAPRLQPTVEQQLSPIPGHLVRSNSLQANPSERLVTIQQPPPPPIPILPPCRSASFRESSSQCIRADPVAVSSPTDHRSPRQTRNNQQGLSYHRSPGRPSSLPSEDPLYGTPVNSFLESQGSFQSGKEPETRQVSGKAAPPRGGSTICNNMLFCNLSELSLDVCFGGDTQKGAAAAVAAAVVVEPSPDVQRERRTKRHEAPVSTASDAVTVPEKRKESRERNDNKYGEKKHLSCFGHGKLWTCFTIFFAWAGVVLSILSRQSTEFVHLGTGYDVSPQYELVHSFGLIYIELCLNATMMHDSQCQILRLSTEEVDDSIFNLSRILLGLATALGIALALLISTSTVWESINLKPIGVGFLVAYLFQSFSFLFFDTDLCNDYSCHMGPGGILCIVASICWMGACVGTAKMDVFKLRTIRARRRNARRLAKADRKARKLLKKRKEIMRDSELERRTSLLTSPSSRDEEEPSHEPANGLASTDEKV